MGSEVVYQAGMTHHRIGTLLAVRAWEFLREFFRRCWLSMSRADLALKEGKTLEVLQERLIGSSGIKGLQVDQSRMERDERQLRVFVLSSRVLTEQEKAFVRATVDDVNGKFGTHILAFFPPPRKK